VNALINYPEDLRELDMSSSIEQRASAQIQFMHLLLMISKDNNSKARTLLELVTTGIVLP